MKSTELTKKKDADLEKLLVSKKEELREHSFGVSGASKGISSKNTRKDVARILTEISTRVKNQDNK